MTTTTTLTVAGRVAAGAAWLDEHHPGWIDRINLDALELYDCKRCVLGQMFGSFELAPLGPPEDPDDWDDEIAEALGFEADGFEPYAELTAAWRELILARRQAVRDGR